MATSEGEGDGGDHRTRRGPAPTRWTLQERGFRPSAGGRRPATTTTRCGGRPGAEFDIGSSKAVCCVIRAGRLALAFASGAGRDRTIGILDEGDLLVRPTDGWTAADPRVRCVALEDALCGAGGPRAPSRLAAAGEVELLQPHPPPDPKIPRSIRVSPWGLSPCAGGKTCDLGVASISERAVVLPQTPAASSREATRRSECEFAVGRPMTGNAEAPASEARRPTSWGIRRRARSIGKGRRPGGVVHHPSPAADAWRRRRCVADHPDQPRRCRGAFRALRPACAGDLRLGPRPARRGRRRRYGDQERVPRPVVPGTPTDAATFCRSAGGSR